MGRTFEQLGKLVTSGPRNTSTRRAENFILEDLAVALGWIGKRHVSDSMLANYTSTSEIPDALISAVSRRWRIPARGYKLNNEQFAQLCRLAITEHFSAKLCPSCRGTGESHRMHKGIWKRIPCPSCMGSGRKPFSIRAKAAAIGVNKITWDRRQLDVLYKRMLDALSAWDSYGRRRIEFALGRR